jgi:hypothetical protein
MATDPVSDQQVIAAVVMLATLRDVVEDVTLYRGIRNDTLEIVKAAIRVAEVAGVREMPQEITH